MVSHRTSYNFCFPKEQQQQQKDDFNIGKWKISFF